MSGDTEVRRALQRIQAPDELEAQRRAWPLVRGAFEAREPVTWHRRNLIPLLAAAAVVVLLAAVLSPPGRALVGSVRDAFESETPKAKPALTSLPAPGPLLVNSPTGPWMVRADGSTRHLTPWWEGAWSPQAKFVAVTRAHQLAAIDPHAQGEVHWTVSRKGAVHAARWSPQAGDRVAYLNGRQLRVIAGDGTDDKVLRRRVGATPPAWRPGGDRELAFSTIDGRIELAETDGGDTVWRTSPGEVPTQLAWSDDGKRLLALGPRTLRAWADNGQKLWTIGLPVGPSGIAFVRGSHRFVLIRYSAATGRSDLVLYQAESNPGEARFLWSAAGDFGSLAMSPNGKWLLVSWVNANEWLFLRLTASKVTAVSGIAELFGGSTRRKRVEDVFPKSVSWCCPASP